jgi:Lon protease-like protein
MSADAPLTLTRLPLFPLQTVLFPGSLLPLRIFEVRYLDMVQRCHRGGVPFGVVNLTQGNEVATAPRLGADTDAAETFQSVGTLAHIEQLTQHQPGLLQVVSRGTQRFRVLQREKLKHGLWVADVELLPPDLPTQVPEELASTVISLQRLVDSLRAQTTGAEHLPVTQPYHWHDAGWVANRWCDLLPVGSELKQRLMALDAPLLRLELVSDVLEKLRLDVGR